MMCIDFSNALAIDQIKIQQILKFTNLGINRANFGTFGTLTW